MVKNGTYQAAAQGHNDEITVAVTVDDNKIAKVEVTKHAETPLISAKALAEIPAKIVADQSTAVDAISGATFTSNGILHAARKALTKAGAGTDEFNEKEKITKHQHQVKTDVVVFGTGLAGLDAAITAKENGADVVLLEKAGRFGGNSVVSGGFMYATGSEFNKDKDNDPADLTKFYENFAKSEGGSVDHELVKTIAENSASAVNYYADKYGVKFTAMPLGLSPHPRTHIDFQKGPVAILEPVFNRVKELKIPIFYNQTHEEIKTENGNIVGVTTKGKYDDYEISCKAIVLAVGGFDGSAKTRDKYAPSAKGARSMSSPYNNGDYVDLTKKFNAGLEFKDGVMGIMTANYLDVTVGANTLILLNTPIAVNNLGKRFTKEGQHYSIMYNDAKNSGGARFFWIFDKNQPQYKTASHTDGSIKCDSLSDVAKLIGADEQTLLATIERYNSFAGKKDPDFGRDDIIAVSPEGPYYVIEGYPTTVAGFGGLTINPEAQVLNTDGQPIAGLYAAGEDATGQIFVHTYPSTGTMLTTCTVFGRIAGKNAAEFSKK
ncbi:FAD-binding protein [Lactobacillus sp. ESL0791]|uniref:FAD-binding protein n=1 Tax=Lactobacillus sp. ESL0791 TaxID=2983234 RepID=UPI0023F6E5D8|nr:FAD-binding protein [Lactobacillus sp. ESL0791]MDF7638197.1 FAD-binding protein [Lactobacillus sp. ESL0791]